MGGSRRVSARGAYGDAQRRHDFLHQSVSLLAAYFGPQAEDIGPGHPLSYQRYLTKKACDSDETWESAIKCLLEQIYTSFNDSVTAWEDVRMPLAAMLKSQDGAYLEW